MNESLLKQKVQRWIVSISVLILIGKFIAFWVTNSVGILTDAMESIVNVVAGLISLYSLWYAAKPKDKDHPFGHGKIELISASLEGMLIMAAGVLIIYEGVKRLFLPAQIASLDVGILIIAVSGLINYLMGWYSIRTGRKYNSIALVAGGKHLQSDTYSTIGLVAGLILLYFTKIAWIDSALALIFGAVIVITGVSILRKTIANLLDAADDQVLHTMVETIAKSRQPDWIDIHKTKAIKYGSSIFIDCDLTVPWYYTVMQGHKIADDLRDALVEEFGSRVQVSVHSDPCKPKNCKYCSILDCPHRQAPFETMELMSLERIIQSSKDPLIIKNTDASK